MLAAMALFSVLLLAWGSRTVRGLAHEAIASTRQLLPAPDPAKVGARQARRERRRRFDGSTARI